MRSSHGTATTEERPPLPLPRWARVLDVLSIALALMAIVVAISGGFRLRMAGIWIGVTTPYPLLLWALVIGIGRHAAAPQAPLLREAPRQLSEWLRTTAVVEATRTFAGTRAIIFFVGYLAVFTFGYAGERAPMRHFDNELMNLPVRWDAGWYLDIATGGYRFDPDAHDVQQNVVFFPAYPMLVRAVGRLLGGKIFAYVLAGTLLSLAAFWGALIYLYAFTREAFGAETARTALWLIASYPFALFFGGIYTESLFLLGVVATFFHFTRSEFGRAAAWGLLVGLTRLNGALLSIPLLTLAVARWLPPALVRRRSNNGIVWNAPSSLVDGSLTKAVTAALMPSLGLLIYAALIWRMTGTPMAWATGHSAWGRSYEGVGTLVANEVSQIAAWGLRGTIAYDFVNALAAIFALATVWPVARRIGLAYAVFMMINVLPPLMVGGFLSAGRFSSVLFPAFVWLADIIPPAHRAGWIASFAAFQACNAALHYTWRPLF
jgi:mannosyltransferase PIG-V